MYHPLGVLKAAVSNAVEQFALVWPNEAWADPGELFSASAWTGADFFEVAPFLHSCIANLSSCVPAIPKALIASSVVITVLLSFGVVVAHFVAARRNTTATRTSDPYQRAIVFALLVLVGLVANAAICGALSGPHTRYQTRVVWLAVVAAGVLEATHPIIVPWFRRLFARTREL
jgi:hypothetical protein